MVKYDCGTKCGRKHPFSKKKRNFCKDVQKCACGCGPLESMAISLYDSCIQSCNADPFGPTGIEYLNQFDPETLHLKHRILIDGFDPRETVEYMELQDAKDAAEVQRQDNNRIILIAFGILALISLGFILR